LWIITVKSTVFVLCASVEPGLWQVTQYCTSRRPPPWNISRSWQALQAVSLTISREKMPVVAPVDGCQV